ncbi:MAG: serpin family protein [Desulfobacteraceae bacterium 4572_88]|nr:MAG: serpin family protein [Desulfobacteraceae bacterium 4572_88]
MVFTEIPNDLDYNGNNKIEGQDVIYALQVLAGLISQPGDSVETMISEKSRVLSPDVSEADWQALVAGNTDFAFDLYQAISDGDDSLFYSPYSISLALAMTYAGAKNDTEQQMADTLHFTLPQEQLHPAFNFLDLALASRGEGAEGQDGEGFRLNVANATWGQTGYNFLSSFVDVLGENYGAGLNLLDFSSDPEVYRVTINTWVSDQTEEKIKDLIPQGAISALTRLVLTNAIYFNAAWKFPFDEEMTKDALFYPSEGQEISVTTMSQTEQFGYVKGEGYQAVELLYDGDELSMLILLPDEGNLDAFEASLDRGQLDTISEGLDLTNMNLALPKFRYESGSVSLKDTLTQMGMPDAFGGNADFSGINGTKSLFISDVIHKAFVSVDEAGTEAAAATAVIMDESVPPEPISVAVNRPFIFLIRDIQTGAILFVGKITQPEV